MTKQSAPIVINGSHGEGGGAMFRTALAVATLTQQGVRVHNVRGATRKPGLTSEDLTFLKAISQTCQARVLGDDLGSNDVTFTPTKPPRGIHDRFEINAFEQGLVPGNALIVLESLLPVLARGMTYSKVIVQGETYNPNTLSFDAYERVTLAAHRKQGIYAYPKLEIAGFGYGAQGEASIEVEPSALEPVDWQRRGSLREISAVVATGQLSESVGHRGKAQLEKLFAEAGMKIEAEALALHSKSPGCLVTVCAQFESGMGAATAMGQKGMRIEQVAINAFGSFMEWYETDATVDPYLADQLLLPAAFAEGASQFKTSMVTARLTTLAWVIKQFTPIHITILGREGTPGTVKISR